MLLAFLFVNWVSVGEYVDGGCVVGDIGNAFYFWESIGANNNSVLQWIMNGVPIWPIRSLLTIQRVMRNSWSVLFHRSLIDVLLAAIPIIDVFN